MAAHPNPPATSAEAARAAAPKPRGGVLGFLQTALFNLGAVAVAYVLLLSGVHKFSWKLWGLELSQQMYDALDRHFLLATRKGYEALDALLQSREGLPPLAAALPAHRTWKHLVGGVEIILSLLWMTRSWWRTAATGSALVMLSWATLAVFPPSAPTNASPAAAKATRDDELSFACVLLGLCFFLRWIGPTPQLPKPKEKRR